MREPTFKAVIEDSYRNKYFFYYSGTSVCCKEVSKDGAARDTIIASQVNDNFLATIDLQDRVFAACYNKEKGIYIMHYSNGDWKLEHILSIQSNVNMKLLSLFTVNGALHIIYAKQMTIANFYNIVHLYKPSSPDSYDANTTWRKNNICEMYAESLGDSYSAVMSKEGAIHLICEWFDGTGYLINYCWFDSVNDGWKKKYITSLFKKDISLDILYEEGFLHLLCYTYEDDASAIFCYVKKEGSGKDFEFFCLDRISTEVKIQPFFHAENSIIYASWVNNNRFYQYTLNREQKNWSRKIASIIPANEPIQNVIYKRNRKGKYWIVKQTYFTIDYKYNINLPYFKDTSSEDSESKDSTEKTAVRNADGDLISYIPYLIDEVKALSQTVKTISEKIEQLEARKPNNIRSNPTDTAAPKVYESKSETNGALKLKKSSFKDEFMKSNKLLSRPEAAAIFVGSANLPNPEELSKKEEIEVVENQAPASKAPTPPEKTKLEAASPPSLEENQVTKEGNDNAAGKDSNLFKKLGDFFK